MSAPPLPDIFGNYALGDFVEVVAPAAVSWWPQTAGWLVVGLVLGGLALRYLWRRLRHWWRNRYRREALQRLAALESAPGDHDLAVEINRLLKLTALAAWSRQRVAGLSGEPWTAFLNSVCPEPPFDRGLTEVLETGPYRTGEADAGEARRLLLASRSWIENHRGPGDA